MQHRPEKAFLKERDDLADTVLDSYMRNTSDVLRMIEVISKPTAQATSITLHLQCRIRTYGRSPVEGCAAKSVAALLVSCHHWRTVT